MSSEKTPFEKRLSRRLRKLPNPPESLPTHLRERVLASLPDRAATTRERLRRKEMIARRVLLVGGAAAVVGAGLIAGPRLLVPGVQARDVQTAIGDAKTWRFDGFRIKNGKKVPWTIQGTRDPFSYEEYIGDEFLIDDGKHRVHYIPATPATKTRLSVPGLALIRRSSRNAETLSDPRAGFLAGVSGDPENLGIRRPQRGSTTLFEGKVLYGSGPTETSVLTVDNRSRLPVGYSVKRVEGAVEREMASLTMRYNVQLVSASRASLPTGTRVVDLTETTRDPAAKGERAWKGNGVAVAASRAVMDRDGTARVTFRAWLGNTPFDPNTIPAMLMLPRSTGGILGIDNLGMRYAFVVEPGANFGMDLYLTPLEPPASGAKRPESIELTLPIALEIYEAMGNSGRGNAILKETIRLTARFEPEPVALDYDNPKNFRNHVGWHANLAGESAQSRAMAYGNLPTVNNPFDVDPAATLATLNLPSAKQRLERQAFWWNRAADVAEATGGKRFAGGYRQNARNAENELKSSGDPR